MIFDDNEDSDLLTCISNIIQVMKEDDFDKITRDQINLMGDIAQTEIHRSIQTTKNLLEIADMLHIYSDLSMDNLRLIGNIVLKISKDQKVANDE